jgi:hypothetical protein
VSNSCSTFMSDICIDGLLAVGAARCVVNTDSELRQSFACTPAPHAQDSQRQLPRSRMTSER